MFSGFKLFNTAYDEHYYKKGLRIYNRYQQQSRLSLESYISVDGSVNATSIQSDWFPQIKADIFLCHSHEDEKIAITLAGFFSELGLNVFIDSCIWGYAPDLLKSIDHKFCMNFDNSSYLYRERNKSTSYVHMLLSTALNMMIDKTECIIILNTPNSVNSSGIIQETQSPWIYAEILMTKLVRKKELEIYRQTLNKSLNESVRTFSTLKFKFQLDMGHLIPINGRDLDDWAESYADLQEDKFALDVFYELLENKFLKKSSRYR